MLPVRVRDEQKGVSCGPPREGAPRGPPTFLGEGALHEPLTYLEEGAPQAPQAVWKKPCGNLQSAQEKGHPMAPQPTGKGAPHRLPQPTWQKEHPGDSQTPNPLWTTDTPCSLHLQDQEHPKNLPLQAPEAPPCPTGSQHCTPLAFTSLLEKKPQTEPKVPLWLPAPPGCLGLAAGCKGPPHPSWGGHGVGGAREGPPWADALWLVPAGARGSPLCTHALRGEGYGFGGHPRAPRAGAGGGPCTPVGRTPVPCVRRGAGGAPACGDTRVQTCACRDTCGHGGHTPGGHLQPPPRRGVPEACKCMYIYKYKYIYIHCAHGHVCLWQGAGGLLPTRDPRMPL